MADTSPQELADFPVVIDLPVQWGDQDAFGHVNNAVYLRWFESARIAYLERIDLAETSAADQIGPILAATDCNYRRQLKYPDRVRVGARITRIGRSSIAIEYRIWSDRHQAVAADGHSTLVVFDYRANQPHPVTEPMRAAIEKLEGKSFRS